MKRLKLFFACLLMAVLSIGQVWAADPTVTSTFTNKDWAVGDGEPVWTASTITTTQLTSGKGVQVTLANIKNAGGFTLTNSTIKNIEGLDKIIGVSLNVSSNGTGGSISGVTVNGTTFQCNSSDTYTVTKSDNQTPSFTHATGDKGDIVISFASTATSKSLYTLSITVTYTTSGGGSEDPAVSADPDEVTDVPAAGVTNQTIDLTYENITGYETEASVHPNADGTGTLSPAWLSASVSDADDYATVTYSVSANDGAARTAYIKVYTTDGDKEATTIIPVSQVKYSAPTGTFELFSGDLTEGDYVICSGTTALKNALATNTSYIGYETVTVSEGIITNPLEELVWHLAQSGEYWTIHNVAANNYAASTGAKNKGQVITDGTDDKALWTASGTSSYEFVNKANTAASVNSNLRYNSGYGFACYSTSTGSALTLYKKQVEGQPKAPTFSIPGGNYETAQSVELSCETEDVTIHYTLDGTNPTNASPVYSTALAINSTTTIKAIAIKNDVSSTVASATYTIIVWQTVADVWDDITEAGPLNAHIYGYVSQTNVGGYDNNFYISDNGSTEGNQLYAYRMNMNSFSVAVGDKVKLAGDLTDYQGTKEFKYANQGATQGLVVALEAKGALQSVAVSGTPIKTEYAVNEDFDPAGLKVMGTYANGFVGEITEGITWGNDLTDGKVTESTTVHVTATVGGKTSPVCDVAVTVAAKTLESIAVGTASYTIYTGEVLPKPVVTATFSEGDPEDVSAFAVYDTESVFDTEVIDNPDPQTITVSYTFGGATQTATYTVSVKDYANADAEPYSVTEALHIITAAIGNVESAREIVVAGTVSAEKVSNYKNRYKISDGANELLVYNGKGFNDEAFTDANYPKVGDVMVVKGKVIYFNNNTPEFASGKSYPLSQIRPATIAIENVTSFEVGATDLTENDLVITTASDGDITFVSGDETKATIVSNVAIHAVAPGTVTITANLAATENDDALNYAAASTTFDVTVIAATVKYAISFDGNGADGGDAPEFASEAAAGANITLPANTYTYTGHSFTGWKVYDENEDEVTVTAGAFTMPASPVTIKAQWAEISVWATTYTSNVTLSYTGTGETNSQVKINDEDYAAQKVGSSGNDGSVVVTVPYGTHTLHFHAVAWNGKSVTIAASGVENMSESSFILAADPGFKSSGTYTLENDPVGQYFVMTFTAVTEETQITFSKTAGDDKRFMLYGVNQEGGVLPVLDHIAISGDLDNKSYKAGQSLDMTGLAVEATYTLGGTPQTPVDVTNNPGLTWTYDPLVENQTEVTVTAHFGEETANKTITGLEVASADPKIYVSTLNVNFASVEVGESVPAAETVTVTLTNVASVTATLGGTNADAFSVSPASLTESGDITISILANTDAAASYSATLTISDGAEGAEDKTINLSFAVIEPVVNEEYQLVSDVASLAAGDQIIIVAENEGDYYTLDGSISSQYFPSTAVSISAGIITAPSTSAIILGKDEDDWTMSMGGQLIGATAAKKASLGNASASNTWTIAIAENVATITNTTTTYGSLQFNYNSGTNPRFLNYTSTQTAVAIYKKVAPTPPTADYSRDVTVGNYGTICLPNGGTISGAKLFDLEYFDQANTLYLLEVNGNAMEAGRPYIFLPSVATIEVFYTDDANEPAGSFNGLVGSYSQAVVAIGTGDEANYILLNNEYHLVNSLAYVGANRAYIHMAGVPTEPAAPAPGAAPRRRVAMSVNGENAAQGIEDVQGDNVQSTKVLINGNLYILRGEKVYDATGRLVK